MIWYCSLLFCHYISHLRNGKPLRYCISSCSWDGAPLTKRLPCLCEMVKKAWFPCMFAWLKVCFMCLFRLCSLHQLMVVILKLCYMALNFIIIDSDTGLLSVCCQVIIRTSAKWHWFCLSLHVLNFYWIKCNMISLGWSDLFQGQFSFIILLPWDFFSCQHFYKMADINFSHGTTAVLCNNL